jgi:hypothetical protein
MGNRSYGIKESNINVNAAPHPSSVVASTAHYNEGLHRSLLAAAKVRNAEWRAMPVISTTDEKLVILKKVNNVDNEVASFIIAGDYTVDWGDGTTGNYDSGKQADHTYTYSNISGNALSDGSKQVLITITPQSGKSLTSVNLQVRNPAYSGAYETGYLEIVGRLPNVTALQIGYDLASGSKLVNTNLLTSVDITDTKQLTTADHLFYYCRSLRYAWVDTTAATSMNNMFS